jgi:hypothetical protein
MLKKNTGKNLKNEHCGGYLYYKKFKKHVGETLNTKKQLREF